MWQRRRRTELNAIKYRFINLLRFYKTNFCTITTQIKAELPVTICICKCSLTYLYTCLKAGNFLWEIWLDSYHAVHHVRTYTQEILIPHPEMLGITPCLEECTGAVYPGFSFTRMCIGILAKTSNSSFHKCLTVHISE